MEATTVLARAIRRCAAGALLGVALADPGGTASAQTSDTIPAQAGDTAPGSSIRAALVTFGPGAVYWERFGHNAIWVQDSAAGIDVMFNYGMFDFNQENFLGRFIKGRMLYRLAVQDAQGALRYYREANRSVWVQQLNLTPAQRVALRDLLVENARPENREYRYDYYYDNCSTRVRDALDRVLGGRIRAATASRETGRTFRFHTQRLTATNVPYAAGLLAGLGNPVDRPISAWEEMFIPMLLRDHLRTVTVLAEDGTEVPLVQSERQVFVSSAEAPWPRPPQWTVWFLSLGLALAGVMGLAALISAEAGRWALLLAGALWSLVVGTLGVVLAGLWLATDHATSYGNENVFQLTPLALPLVLLLPLALFGVKWARPAARWLAVAVGISSLLGFVLQALPGLDQVNGPIIAFVLPVNVTLAFTVWWRLREGPVATEGEADAT